MHARELASGTRVTSQEASTIVLLAVRRASWLIVVWVLSVVEAVNVQEDEAARGEMLAHKRT